MYKLIEKKKKKNLYVESCVSSREGEKTSRNVRKKMANGQN
jgi:hypothetical protein